MEQDKNRCFKVTLSHPQQFKEKTNSLWNPEWQAIGHGCSISLFAKHKLKLSGNIQILRDRQHSKRVILVKEFRHLHYGMRKSFTFDARLWAQQSA
jgi:hypothetical protein